MWEGIRFPSPSLSICACERYTLSFQAGADKIGTDESEFNRVLCLRSYPQLRQMFQSYRIKYGKEIESVIDSETSGYIKDGYLAIGKVKWCQYVW